MRFKNWCKNILAAAFLGFTLFSVLATSQLRDDDKPASGQNYVISDCVTPVLENVVTIANNVVVAPGGVSFTDFGFPSATIAQTMTGTVGAVQRECTVTYGEGGLNGVKNRWVYSCFDNGTFKCTIYIEPR